MKCDIATVLTSLSASPKLTQMLDLEDKGKTSVAIQWLSIHLPMQGTWVQSLVWEDSTCHRATKPTYHDYCHVPQGD